MQMKSLIWEKTTLSIGFKKESMAGENTTSTPFA